MILMCKNMKLVSSKFSLSKISCNWKDMYEKILGKKPNKWNAEPDISCDSTLVILTEVMQILSHYLSFYLSIWYIILAHDESI